MGLGTSIQAIIDSDREWKLKLAEEERKKEDRERRLRALEEVGALGSDIVGSRGNMPQPEMTQDVTTLEPGKPATTTRERLSAGPSVRSIPELRDKMELLRYQYPDLDFVRNAGERFDTRSRFDQPQALSGAQQFLDKYQQENPEMADLGNLGANLGMGDVAFGQAEAITKKSGLTNAGMGRSSAAARFMFTQEHPELVDEAMVRVEDMRNRGWYSDEELNTIATKVKTDVLGGIDALDRLRRPTETAVRTEIENLGPRTATAASTAAAGVTAKEGAEQRILSGITVPGYRAIPGVRQTENSINNVKTAKPQLDALRQSIADLVNEYEKNGWKPIGPQSANYESKVRLAQLLSKETALFNLGVLNGPDLDILEQVITNPGSFKSGVQMARYGQDHIGKRLNNVLELVDYRTQKFYESNGLMPESQSKTEQTDEYQRVIEALRKRARSGDQKAVQYLRNRGESF